MTNLKKAVLKVAREHGIFQEDLLKRLQREDLSSLSPSWKREVSDLVQRMKRREAFDSETLVDSAAEIQRSRSPLPDKLIAGIILEELRGW